MSNSECGVSVREMVRDDIETLNKWFAYPTLDSLGGKELFAWGRITTWFDSHPGLPSDAYLRERLAVELFAIDSEDISAADYDYPQPPETWENADSQFERPEYLAKADRVLAVVFGEEQGDV